MTRPDQAAIRCSQDAHVPAAPSMTVSSSWTGSSVPLGLDRALALAGGSLRPKILDDLLLDYAPAIIEAVSDSLDAQAAAGRDWFRMPALATISEDPAAHVHVARRIARVAGVPLLCLDVAEILGGGASRLTAVAPEMGLPPAPVVGMAVSGCANPIVMVTRVHAASADACADLAAMLDPRSSARWTYGAASCTFDLSAASWIVPVAHEHQLPPPLYTRLRQVRIDARETATMLATCALSVLHESIADLDAELPLPFAVEALRAFVEGGGRRRRPLGDLRRVADALVQEAMGRAGP